MFSKAVSGIEPVPALFCKFFYLCLYQPPLKQSYWLARNIKVFRADPSEKSEINFHVPLARPPPKIVLFRMAYKDSMFRSLFNNEKSLLELYNAPGRFPDRNTECGSGLQGVWLSFGLLGKNDGGRDERV